MARTPGEAFATGIHSAGGQWDMIRTLIDDVNAVTRNDPAATSRIEVLLFHTPLHAIIFYRIAHF